MEGTGHGHGAAYGEAAGMHVRYIPAAVKHATIQDAVTLELPDVEEVQIMAASNAGVVVVDCWLNTPEAGGNDKAIRLLLNNNAPSTFRAAPGRVLNRITVMVRTDGGTLASIGEPAFLILMHGSIKVRAGSD